MELLLLKWFGWLHCPLTAAARGRTLHSVVLGQTKPTQEHTLQGQRGYKMQPACKTRSQRDAICGNGGQRAAAQIVSRRASHRGVYCVKRRQGILRSDFGTCGLRGPFCGVCGTLRHLRSMFQAIIGTIKGCGWY
jgi:hypothetical protein